MQAKQAVPYQTLVMLILLVLGSIWTLWGSPTLAAPLAHLESPAPDAFLRSGIGLIRGWACEAGRVEVPAWLLCSDFFAKADADIYAHAEADSDACTDAYAEADLLSDANADGRADGGAHADSRTHAGADPGPVAGTHSRTHSDVDADTGPSRHRPMHRGDVRRTDLRGHR